MVDSPKPAAKNDTKDSTLPMTTAEMLAHEAGQDKKVTRWAMGIAVIFHVIIFAMHWPSFAGGLSDAKEKKNRIYVVKQVKFKQPPRREMQQIPKPKTQQPLVLNGEVTISVAMYQAPSIRPPENNMNHGVNGDIPMP